MMAEQKEKFGTKKTAVISDTQIVRVKIDKPGWPMVATHFQQFLREGFTPNVFQPHTNEMIMRPKIHYRPDGLDLTEGAAEKKKLSPLETYILSDYILVLTMLGTSQPKAIVTDPKGRSHMLTVNPPTWIGKKRYEVKRINRYNVELESMGERTQLNSIEPPYLGLGSPDSPKLKEMRQAGKTKANRDLDRPDSPLETRK